MKPKFIITLLIVVAMISCKSNNESIVETMSPEQIRRHVTKELNDVVSAAIDGMIALNADTVCKYFSKEEFEGFAGNGLNLRSFEETYTVLQYMYGEIESSNISLSDEKYVVLSEESALYTANYNEELHDKKEGLHYSNGVFTFIFKKIDDQWMIIHMHISSYPYTKVN